MAPSNRTCSTQRDYVGHWEAQTVPDDQRALYQRFPNCSCNSGTWICPAEAAGLPQPILHTLNGDSIVNLTGYRRGIEQYILRTYDGTRNTM